MPCFIKALASGRIYRSSRRTAADHHRSLREERFLASAMPLRRHLFICLNISSAYARTRVNNDGITETPVLIRRRLVRRHVRRLSFDGLDALSITRALFASDFLSSSERTDIIPHPPYPSPCGVVLPRTTVIRGRLIRATTRVRDAWRKNIDAVTYERPC